MRKLAATCVVLVILCLAAIAADATGATVAGAHPSGVRSSRAALYVVIDGDDEVATWWTCEWQAYAGGGTPPYTLEWQPSYGLVEDYSSGGIWRGHATIGGGLFLSVKVTDANGQTASREKPIYSGNYIPLC